MASETIPQPPGGAINIAPFKTDVHPVWCPGCGDFGVLTCIYRMLATKQLSPENIVIVSGIGCSSRLPAYVNAYGFHTVHGRVLPVATGVKTANPNLEVIAVGGDGDAYSIGAGHIPHAARRNIDVCYIVMDNEVYGLTKGQGSATAPVEMVKGTTPFGQLDDPLNPIAMAIAYDISFVARGYSGKPKELTELITQGVDHKGFALLEVISPCTTFHDTYKPVSQRIRFVDASHDPTDRLAAMKLALEKETIPIGVIYKNQRTSFSERIKTTQERSQAKGTPDFNKLLESFQ
ncbi:MAG: 2-oxoacid:ferredoxin oxidoreductase subunit beta [Candidatus Omnitrophica bacterium]|nr:2-oxoacid:ferredoxin oxidoreductase subunit beta [Candidatus Omnitrophota bacterium]